MEREQRNNMLDRLREDYLADRVALEEFEQRTERILREDPLPADLARQNERTDEPGQVWATNGFTALHELRKSMFEAQATAERERRLERFRKGEAIFG